MMMLIDVLGKIAWVRSQISLSSVQENPVLGVSDKVRVKPFCSATETSLKIEISLVANLDVILSNK